MSLLQPPPCPTGSSLLRESWWSFLGNQVDFWKAAATGNPLKTRRASTNDWSCDASLHRVSSNQSVVKSLLRPMIKSSPRIPFAFDPGRDTLFFVGFFGLAIFVYSFYGLDLPLRRDNAQYIYTAQRLIAGEMPYQSLFDMKAPLTSFVIAGVMYVGEFFLSDGLKIVRLFFMGLSLATCYVVYQLSTRIFHPGRELWLAPLAILGCHGLLLQSAIGAEPKVLMLLLFSIALILLIDKRWLSLGIVASLCAFTWQPSGVLFISALGYATFQPGHAKAYALGRLVSGFLAPSVVIFGIFWLSGALEELFDALLILHSYLSREDVNELFVIMVMLPFGFPFSFPMIIVGLLAFTIYLVIQLRRSPQLAWSDNYHLPLLFIILVFSFASLLNFQSYPDFFIFLPFAALGTVVLFRCLPRLSEEAWRGRDITLPLQIIFVSWLLITPVLNAAFADIWSNHAAVWRGAIERQRESYRTILLRALPDYNDSSKLVVIGVPEMPALLRFRNLTRHVSLGSIKGYDAYISSKFGGEFKRWLRQLSNYEPELLVVKQSDLVGYSNKNLNTFNKWLRIHFSLVSENQDIDSDKFRSRKIETWIPKTSPN